MVKGIDTHGKEVYKCEICHLPYKVKNGLKNVKLGAKNIIHAT